MNTKLTLLFAGIGLTGMLNAQASKQLWTPMPENEISVAGARVIVPQKYKTYHLVSDNLKQALWNAPSEKDARLQNSPTVIELPMPDGTMKKYRVVNSPVMAPELQAAYPEIRTFNIMGVDEPGIYGKLDFSEMGFHAWIRKVGTDVYIDPYCQGNYVDYITYNSTDHFRDPSTIPHCLGVIKDPNITKRVAGKGGHNSTQAAPCIGDQLNTYRTAIACTGEYAVAATGLSSPTVAQTLAKIVTTLNRVDGVYETDLACKMVLVPTETLVVFTNASTDPFTGNNNGNTLIGESQTVIDNNIGDANYDAGHTFSTGGGGLSTLGGICNSGTWGKASSITGGPSPTGDKYDIDYVAHEMGHNFGGDHTFNSTTGSCSGNQAAGTMVEPGSGITIMAYAGICSPNDDSAHSIAYFHTASFDEITANTLNGTGANCPVITATGNNPPVVTAPSGFTIPKSTPFILTGSATDPDGDPLTYSWEENDNNSTGHNWNSGAKPFFRNFVPTTNNWRMFPKLATVLTGTYNTTASIGEYLPATAQTLTFRLVARDNKMGGGGVCYSNNTNVTINATAGPFVITAPNTTGITWGSGSTQTVTWNVASTDLTPINTASVNILISYNSGSTFTMLMPNVPNSGSQTITVPTVTANVTTCRIKVEAVGNIFFDINDKNFTISASIGINNYGTPNVGLHLMPNPANDHVQINISGLSKTEKNALSVYDMLGNVVLKDVLVGKDSYEINYDISDFAKGVYVVEVVGTNKKAVSRLVKQ
ncbi:MAG: reprolysin-like metallopeptidase [Bacteroidia bacterium]